MVEIGLSGRTASRSHRPGIGSASISSPVNGDRRFLTATVNLRDRPDNPCHDARALRIDQIVNPPDRTNVVSIADRADGLSTIGASRL